MVNETEAGAVLGRPVDSLAGARRAATELAALGARHAVVTAGAHGAALAGPDGETAIPGYPVTPVDTVGAGDTFVGALAVALAVGLPAAEATRAAAAAGAAAVTRPGAQAGMPRARGHPRRHRRSVAGRLSASFQPYRRQRYDSPLEESLIAWCLSCRNSSWMNRARTTDQTSGAGVSAVIDVLGLGLRSRHRPLRSR